MAELKPMAKIPAVLHILKNRPFNTENAVSPLFTFQK